MLGQFLGVITEGVVVLQILAYRTHVQALRQGSAARQS